MDCGLFAVRFLFLGYKNGAAAPVDYSSTFATAPLEFNFEDSSTKSDGIVIQATQDNPISRAAIDITYTDANGEDHIVSVPVEHEVQYLLENSDVRVTMNANGEIAINLGSQIAIKKVSIKITGMLNNNNLAEISKVEFVNGMENRIPDPVTDIPENLVAVPGNESFKVSWDKANNVTGYEVKIKSDGKEEVKATKQTSLDVTSFLGKDLVNKQEYRVSVQSVNGMWKSGYSEEIVVVPKANKKPDAPDNLKLVGKYSVIEANWKKDQDADFYNLYYREKGAGTYTKVENIVPNSYRITNLKEKTSYEVYVTGVNELGEGKPSITGVAETTDLKMAKMPRYRLINMAEEGKVSEHIISASIRTGNVKESELDTTSQTAWATVDNNKASYWETDTWDAGGYNALGYNPGANFHHGLMYEFDKPYTLKTIALQEIVEQGRPYSYVQIRYWDENGKQSELSYDKISIRKTSDDDGRGYYWIELPNKITAKKIQIGIAREYVDATISVSEVYFYHYDSIKEDIMDLYEDDLHTVLKPDVTQETIDALRTRINSVDEASGEYHPDRVILERELKTAEDILQKKPGKSMIIHNTISTSDSNKGFGGLNAWQPLGVNAAAGDQITIFVGHPNLATGSNTNLQLVSTQYHSESSPLQKVIGNLKIGRNDITIPKLGSMASEAGGALYVQYTGNNANDRYAVRVSGGTQVPVLDLYKVESKEERLAKVKTYLQELEAYVNDMESLHKEIHQDSTNKNVAYDYDEKNCILGATDILLDTMMLSLPAPQILAGCKNSPETLLKSMDSMDEMMYLFYQHKGLNDNAKEDLHKIPKGHLNIRYQRMFAGAFMYAAGNHIGIEWNETKGMVSGSTAEFDEEGKHISGQYFGWGIGHEIGHCINQGAYAVAEVTNNYFAVLAQANETNEGVRFQYDKVYDKVTSGTKGPDANVFTNLAMYWQLHLAYDNGYNYKTYENYDEQLKNIFFARVDTYARDTKKAPAPNGVALTLTGDKNQAIMRLACAAAEKNILTFFERWGMTPDATTKAYAEQFEVETRAIYYVNDEARLYRKLNSGSILGTEGAVEVFTEGTKATVNKDNASQVDFVFETSNIPADDILGYEIVRTMINGGQIEKEVVGFTTENTFTDLVTDVNNRVITYEVTLIDKHLNRSAVKVLDSVKISHDGSMDKNFWTVTTNMESTNEEEPGHADENTPCAPEAVPSITRAIDGKIATAYKGIAKKDAEIVLEFNKSLLVTGFKYTVTEGTPIQGYEILVRDENMDWKSVAKGNFAEDKEVQTIYFENEDGKYISTYNTDAVKLIIKDMDNKEISISELDVIGVTGDNVDFRKTEGGDVAIGRLTDDFQYGENATDVIPKDSIIFTGSYKGNPAYNVVLLYDEEGMIVGGIDEEGNLLANQTIMADVPKTGNIQDVSDGTWIYWVEPEYVSSLSGKNIRAELYRVNNALTNEGQRLVSDTFFVTVPENLPNITLQK